MNVHRVGELWGLVYELGNRMGESSLGMSSKSKPRSQTSRSAPTKLAASRVSTPRVADPLCTAKRRLLRPTPMSCVHTGFVASTLNFGMQKKSGEIV